MEQIGYHHFYTCLDGPLSKPGSVKRSSVMTVFQFDKEIDFLFPYINAVIPGAELYNLPDTIRFIFDDVQCVLYPDKCIATPFNDRQEAIEFRNKMMEWLNRLILKKDEITPKYKVFKKISVTDIIKLLPKTNCGECGFSTCLAFAAMLSRQAIKPSFCPYIGKPIQEQVTYPVFDECGKPVSSITLDIDTEHIEKPRTDIEEKNKKAIANTEADIFIKPLTRREIQVLSLISNGKTNPQISETLHISTHTVKSHVINLFNKIGVSDRTQAAVWAVRHKIV